jgi:hypothetical protein
MRTDRPVTLIGALLDGARTDRKTVFLRTLLFGIAGAIGGAIAMEVAPRVVGGPSISAYWFWMCASGFVGGAFGNLVNEYFGLYTNRMDRFRTWVTQSWFRITWVILAIGVLGGWFWGCGFWFLWTMTALLRPDWALRELRIIPLAKNSAGFGLTLAGFGLTLAGLMWLFVLWQRRRIRRRSKSN